MTHTEAGEIEYDKTTTVHPLTLIREVKKHELLYNKTLSEYSDNAKKELLWEKVHQVLFPNYDNLSEDTKSTIKKTVRKRWKSLRDALVKDHRLRIENPINEQKKQSHLVQEMQFLVPYIQTPRVLKYGSNMENNEDSNYSPDFCRLMNETTIDLTYQEGTQDSNVQTDDDGIVASEALYPSVRLTTSDLESGEVEWRNGYGFSASTNHLNYTICEIQEPPPYPEAAEYNKQDNQVCKTLKRKRTNSDIDLQSKVIELVERCNTESGDEDRMFLLSLLSDFKRVPVQKKLKVKAAFVTALADALD